MICVAAFHVTSLWWGTTTPHQNGQPGEFISVVLMSAFVALIKMSNKKKILKIDVKIKCVLTLFQPPGGVPAAQPMLPNMDPRLQGEHEL